MTVTHVYLIVMRAIHVVGGALWAGSAVSYFLFVEPAARQLGPAAPNFMRAMIEKRRYPAFMNLVSALTIVSGLFLYWSSSGGLQPTWITSGPGLGFTIGSVVALVVYGIGFFLIRPRAERLGELSKAIAAAGGPPAPEQAAEIQRISHEMNRYSGIDAVLLTISLLFMGTARYWNF